MTEPPAERLSIRLNGEPFELEGPATIATLLTVLGQHPRTVAVEHNGEIVRRQAFAATELAAGDQLELVRFVQGGRSS